MKILCIVGARPNFMKIAPILEALKDYPRLRPFLVHTGQHYDEAMSKAFFDDLGIPKPDLNLEVGSGTHAEQTAAIMARFEPVVLAQRPDLVLVVGDVNSTLACSVTAAKLGVPVAHVEAGLRSFDRTMPEEINRLVTDALSDLLFTTCEEANEHLRREGVAPDKIHFVGNVMIDTLIKHVELARRSAIRRRLGVGDRGYGLITLHRPSNVDEAGALGQLLSAFEQLQAELPIVFPMHPRTRARVKAFGLEARIEALRGLILTEPLGYLDFLNLMMGARLVLTDSGGIQEETTYLQVPCLTLRPNTERRVTITDGTNRLVPLTAERIVAEARAALSARTNGRRVPPLWDGQAAPRIAKILDAYAQSRGC
jgi:UDP-N-acetylglucosamine 2-epimerase (non-hydrolysing)